MLDCKVLLSGLVPAQPGQPTNSNIPHHKRMGESVSIRKKGTTEMARTGLESACEKHCGRNSNIVKPRERADRHRDREKGFTPALKYHERAGLLGVSVGRHYRRELSL